MKLDNIEIGKALLNHKKSKILSVVKHTPKTVKEIAEELEEKVSRLYYHINSLEELGLIKIEREEMVGNLCQKYYVANNILSGEFTFRGEDAYENKEYILNQLFAYVNDALTTIKEDLSNEKIQKKSEASLLKVKLSVTEWEKLNQNIRELIKEANNNSGNRDISSYNYMLMSYTE